MWTIRFSSIRYVKQIFGKLEWKYSRCVDLDTLAARGARWRWRCCFNVVTKWERSWGCDHSIKKKMERYLSRRVVMATLNKAKWFPDLLSWQIDTNLVKVTVCANHVMCVNSTKLFLPTKPTHSNVFNTTYPASVHYPFWQALTLKTRPRNRHQQSIVTLSLFFRGISITHVATINLGPSTTETVPPPQWLLPGCRWGSLPPFSREKKINNIQKRMCCRVASVTLVLSPPPSPPGPWWLLNKHMDPRLILPLDVCVRSLWENLQGGIIGSDGTECSQITLPLSCSRTVEASIEIFCRGTALKTHHYALHRYAFLFSI